MGCLLTVTDWFKENDWEHGFAWGSCYTRQGDSLVKLTPDNSVGGSFLRQISQLEYIDRKIQGFPVKKTKNKYWCMGLKTELREESN